MHAKLDGIDSIVPATSFDVPVGSLTTFRVGGPCDAVSRPASLAELGRLMKFLREREVPYRILGKGSNMLFTDAGFRGVLIVLGESFAGLTLEKDGRFRAGAGLSLPSMANRIARAGIAGFEFSAQIPGAVGGSVAVNAGAFGKDLHSRLLRVRVVEADGQIRDLPSSALEGRYRNTALKGLTSPHKVIAEATFQGELDDPARILATQKEYGRYRESTQPVNLPSAGCVFKNPPGDHSAGWLIENSGAKNLRIGDAQVSDKHANFIVNRGRAKACDVLSLIDAVRECVQKQFALVLQTEIEFVTALAGV